MSWDELADDELEARLIQRGMPPIDARSWVYYREVESAKHQITEFLKEEAEEEVSDGD